MLTHIHIWNFAVVEKLDVEIENGLTIVTGETGAGKSILLDALGLSLGDRADSSIVRHGAERAEISVSFSTHDVPDAEAWLVEHEMNSENECIIRRSISTNGNSRAFINGIPGPIKQLRELGEQLVDLHGQHEHQSLLKHDTQRQLLDDYAKNQKYLEKVTATYTHWQTLYREFQRLTQAGQDRQAQLELLRYQVQELETLNLQAGEVDSINIEHKRLANATLLMTTTENVLQALNENEMANVNSLLNTANVELASLKKLDDTITPAAELLNNALINVQEASRELKQYTDTLDIDPQQLEYLDQRLADITALARKHNINASDLHTLLAELQQTLDKLENADLRLGNLEAEIKSATMAYTNAAQALTRQRKVAAKKLSRLVTESMQTLGMEGGSFEVACETDISSTFSPRGMDTIEFLVSANPGQARKPLLKVASGGELSRISLAIQVITARDTRIATLVFDEVDVGIGGRVAEIVGHQLRKLSEHRQVVCVTHLPQVAALGHYHLRVQKSSDKKTTYTNIHTLDTEQRVDELARMLGGLNITEQTRSHAREMIEQAGNTTEIDALTPA